MQEKPLERLFADATPPASLRDRVIHDVIPTGKRRAPWKPALALVAMLVLAFLSGRATRGVGMESEGSQYLLLLYEGAEYRDDRPMQETVAEYSRWADSLRERRLLTRAHKLDDPTLALLQGRAHESSTITSSDPTGFFIVRADSRDSAAAIAQTSPHLKYGGKIVLRRLL